MKKKAEYIHPERNFWGAGHLVAGVYGPGKKCECCSLHFATKDVLCDECDELCKGKEWCPV